MRSPSMDRMRSPSRRPEADSRGQPSAKPRITGTLTALTPAYSTRMMISPARKFIRAPAAKISSFCQKPWLFRAAGSLESSSSPSMAQKPPMGSRRREYWVSPLVFFSRAGPMPMANSLTRTPQALAARKWPSSWTAMRTPKIRIAAII